MLFIRKYREDELPDTDYLLSVTHVKDAGISSTGFPSDNKELPVAATEIRSWIEGQPRENMQYTKIVHRSELSNWSIRHLFETEKVKFNPLYKTVKLGEIMVLSSNIIEVKPDKNYTRLTVRLFNKGIMIRDVEQGANIGTKRQTQVHAGEFVISKIDGKSAAFGLVDKELDGAIVTPDFMVYDIDTQRVMPEYLEMVLRNEQILNQFRSSSSGTTGRRRLSQKVFEATKIALPSLNEQHKLMADIVNIREKQQKLESQLKSSEALFNQFIFN